jgi:hypothetical protein
MSLAGPIRAGVVVVTVWFEHDTVVARIRASLNLNEPTATSEVTSGADQVLAAVARFLADFTRAAAAGGEDV